MYAAEKLIIIGTSHVSKESVQAVKTVIQLKRPAFVCIELDPERLAGLMKGNNYRKESFFTILRAVGIRGYVFLRIGSFVQNMVAKYTGVVPGEEMKTAYLCGLECTSKIVLIDQPIRVTLAKLGKQITFREMCRFGWELVKGMFGKSRLTFNIAQVPSKEVVDELMEELKRIFPSVYRVLVDERNVIMAKRIIHLMREYPDDLVVAVVGLGHEDAMWEMIGQEISL